MHDAGFVHRDLKPANVMWLPRENRWTVIDFGRTAAIGSAAPVSFTLAYAAPEVAAAMQLREDSVEARPVLDSWALGVLGLEIFTGAPAFDILALGSGRVRNLGRFSIYWASRAQESSFGVW